MSLLEYESKFSSLRMNTRTGGGRSPHKVAMLLSVIDLVESEHLTENRIFFNQNLKDAFRRRFVELADPSDRNNPHLPFFHLRSSGFWHHCQRPGKSDAYGKLTTVSSPGVIDEIISFAYLDDELFELLTNVFARRLLKAALMENLTDHSRHKLLENGGDWNWLECEVIVEDYFSMLQQDCTGQKYSKAEHRRALMRKLNDRSEGSIEYKHQNISAILIEMGQPYINGYKPAFNYQEQLRQVVLAYLAANPKNLESLAKSAESEIVEQAPAIDWSKVFDPDQPDRIPSVREPHRSYLARNLNFSQRERNNRQLGEKGEAFVLEFERYRLQRAGRDDLAREVEWSSKVKGDGLGFDIRSFTEAEEEHFIEVKTTASGKYQPFYVTSNELDYSKEFSRQYSLYRVYEFRSAARIFELKGSLHDHVNLEAQMYKASFESC